MNNENNIPVWFNNLIVRGVMFLYGLALEGVPAHDTIQSVALSWVALLWTGYEWHEEVDAPRIQKAFQALALASVRWPSPKLLMERLPPRPSFKALPRSSLSKAEISANCQKIRELLNGVEKDMRHE